MGSGYSYDSSPLSLDSSHSPVMRLDSTSPQTAPEFPGAQQQFSTAATAAAAAQQPQQRKGRGGRKKNLHPPSTEIMRHRRDAANARERKRMNGLNDAFERLREVVPNLNSEQACMAGRPLKYGLAPGSLSVVRRRAGSSVGCPRTAPGIAFLH